MHALEMFAVYVTPFLILGMVAKRWLSRHAVDLGDVHDLAGKNRGTRKVFLLGSWRSEG